MSFPGGGAGFSIPLGALCAVTGPSGSGKTRLLEQLELNYSPKKLQPRGIAQFAVVVREGIVSAKIPLSRSRTVAKEVALDLLLARFFCELPSARQLGLTANHFSLSHQLGRCSGCDGLGLREVYLETVGTIYEDCELCFGQGFSPIVGNILYDGYTISELYGLGAKELSGVFRSSAEIIAICSSLESVGLGEIALSRRINLLSQSERQRLLLARVFMKRAKGDALLLLEQPLDDLSLEDLDDVLSWLREARGTATTAVFTTLSADVVLRCDHAIALSRSGVIVYNGDPLERGVAYWGEHHYSLPLPS